MDENQTHLGSLDKLRAEWNAIFDRVLAIGRAQGQQQASEVLQSAIARLGGGAVPSSSLLNAPTPSKEQEKPKRTISNRAPTGSVKTAVEKILNDSTIPLTPGKIVAIGRGQDIELKDSSVRMALGNLRTDRKARQTDNGHWEAVHANGSEPSQGSGNGLPGITAENPLGLGGGSASARYIPPYHGRIEE